MRRPRGFDPADADADDPDARVIEHYGYRCLVIGHDPSPREKALRLVRATRALDGRTEDFGDEN